MRAHFLALLALLALCAALCASAATMPTEQFDEVHPLQEKLGLNAASAPLLQGAPVNLATYVDSPDQLDMEALEAAARWELLRDPEDLINQSEEEAASEAAQAVEGGSCGVGGTCMRHSAGCDGLWQSGLCAGAEVSCCAPVDETGLTASNNAKRDKFLKLIRSKLGSKYVWGAAGPNTFDCSGLVYWAAKQVGINLPRVAHDQFKKAGKAVNTVAARQPGDLIFFGKPGQRVYHVGVHVAKNQMINSPNPKSVVRQENYSYWPDRITQARRIF